MVDGVKPLAHVEAFADLRVDLFLVERLEEHEAEEGVESSGVHPAWQKSLAHDRSEVALLDVEGVGCGEEGTGAPSSLTHTLSIVKPVDDGLVELPVVVIHSERNNY